MTDPTDPLEHPKVREILEGFHERFRDVQESHAAYARAAEKQINALRALLDTVDHAHREILATLSAGEIDKAKRMLRDLIAGKEKSEETVN